MSKELVTLKLNPCTLARRTSLSWTTDSPGGGQKARIFTTKGHKGSQRKSF
jgi:hypothetical protein